MKIRLATWDDDPPVGGQGVLVRDLRSALIGRGIDVATLAGHGPFAMRYRRLTGLGHIDMSIALNRFPNLLVDGAPDLVHISGGPGGLQLLRRLLVPVVYTANHTYTQSHRSGSIKHAYGRIEARAYQQAAMVAAISSSTADALRAMGVASSRVRVIWPGINIDDSPPVGTEPGDSTRIVFVGRLEHEKGPLDAIAVMAAVIERVPGVRGFVIGSGSLESEVRTAVDEAGGGMAYLGRLSDQEVQHELRRAAVVLVPSEFEGLGMVVLEAMAARAAVVGYDVAGLRDSIAGHGVLVPHGDRAAMAVACERLVREDSYRADLVDEAFGAVRRQHSWERCAQEFDELYRLVLERA